MNNHRHTIYTNIYIYICTYLRLTGKLKQQTDSTTHETYVYTNRRCLLGHQSNINQDSILPELRMEPCVGRNSCRSSRRSVINRGTER